MLAIINLLVSRQRLKKAWLNAGVHDNIVAKVCTALKSMAYVSLTMGLGVMALVMCLLSAILMGFNTTTAFFVLSSIILIVLFYFHMHLLMSGVLLIDAETLDESLLDKANLLDMVRWRLLDYAVATSIDETGDITTDTITPADFLSLTKDATKQLLNKDCTNLKTTVASLYLPNFFKEPRRHYIISKAEEDITILEQEVKAELVETTLYYVQEILEYNKGITKFTKKV